ncbi:MAG: type II secretion system F family protein [Candidatus Bathyarchaeota archaeon]|nr:type II secretion system F family protein [Candidatus Bathyarchaeota archaeon]
MSKKEGKKGLIAPSFFMAPYRIVGKRLDRFLPYFEDLREDLSKADLKIDFPIYVSYILFFPTLAFITIIPATIILAIIFEASLILALILGFAFGIMGWASIFAFLYFYPANEAGSRKRNIEEELPYLASHMAVLSQGGLTPERIFTSLSMLDTKRVRSVAGQESKNILRDISLLGFDVVTAMQKSTKRSPSRRFADLLNGFIAVTLSGGDMTKFFLSSAKGLMDSARISARQLVETLATIAEIYVAVMVCFPLLVVIMLSVMGMIGGGIGGYSVMSIMYLASYIAVPISALLMLVILDSVLPSR